MQDSYLRFSVAFDDADGEGIVFFGNYFRLVHRAFEQWLPRQGITWQEWFKNKVFGVPLRHVEADYLRPLRPGEDVLVRIQLTEVGEHSVHFEYDMRDLNEQPIARLKTSHVFVSRNEMRKIEIPAELKARLLKIKRV